MPTFTATGSAQTFVSDATGDSIYRIVARGAGGGGATPGYGAIITADVTVPASTTLTIIVGRKPTGSTTDFGGGGGSFVYAGTTLYVAAGGGGGTHTGSKGAHQDASLTTTGKSGTQTPTYGGVGGTDGSGGLAGTGSTWAGAGAGWLTNGAAAPNTAGSGGTSKPSWAGGSGGAPGGYGGGGGGGYSGGGGGHQQDSTGGGGGGGSYNAGTLVSAALDTSSRDGEVSITFVGYADAAPTASITSPASGQQVDPRQPLRMTWTYSDAEGSPQAQYEAAFGVGGLGTPQALSNSATGRTGTIQSWTVPSTGAYKIECWGAEGGKPQSYSTVGGRGAYRYGTMTLTAGEVLKIIVGQQGVGNTYEGGGGGGSFVYRETGAELLCAAGGGGGGSRDYSGTDGLMTEAANSAPNGGGVGGTGGNAAPQTYGAGGGSWNQRGAEASWSPSSTVRPGSACKPGVSSQYDSASGGTQANGGAGNSTTNDGGYGGGGGSHGNSSVAGGGGGGYSGGPGGKTSWHGGGGGGSFVHASMASTGGTSGARTGHGAVVITPLTSWTTSTAANSNAYHDFPANAFPDEKPVTLRVRVHDGTQWSSYATVDVNSDSWTYGSEVASAIQTGVDLPDLAAGSYQAQVRTSDAIGFGPWSASAAFTVLPTSNVKIYQGGAWHTVPNRLRHQASWVVPPNPERL